MAQKDVAESSRLHDADQELKAFVEAVIRRLLLPIQQQLDDVVQRLERLEAGGGGPDPSPSSSALSSNRSFKKSSNGQGAQSRVNSPAVKFSDKHVELTRSMGATPNVRKKFKEILRKANVAGTTSDLYMAYKGPEEKKENTISSEVAESTSTDPVPTDSLQQKGLIPSPRTPLQMMHKAEKKYEVGKISDEEEAKQRQLKGILNKLTPQNFDILFEQVMAVNIDNASTLSGVIAQVFDIALMEPTFSEMRANFCYHLAGELPDFRDNNEKITFKSLLLNKCQEEFERWEREQKEADKADEEGEVKQTAEESEEKREKARRRMLVNIILIGELYKKKMLTERIMHEIISKLLGQYQNPDEEDVEALCKLMSTIGELLDGPMAKDHMDAYFERMAMMSNNMKLSSRVRFMLRDAIDLRENKWQQRRKVVLMGSDLRADIAYGANVGFHPGQGGNFGVPRNPRAQTPVPYVGGILTVLKQSMGPHGVGQRNDPDVDRWQRGVNVQQKGLIPSPHTPLQMMHEAEKNYEVGKVTDEEEAKQRQLRAILNKLTPRKFGKLFEQVKAVKIDNEGTLRGVIAQIFDTALIMPAFCEMYANFCRHLAIELPDFRANNEKITFKGLLLNKCQEEFERGEREQKEADKADEEGEVKQTAEESEEKRVKARRRMLGSLRLIGELYKKKMLTDRIMHDCINKLLGQYQNPDEEDVEALCKLMSSIGEKIDQPNNKDHMDAYFERMAMMSNNMKLTSRVRFMLRDAIDLRKNKWQQRWQQRRKAVLR